MAFRLTMSTNTSSFRAPHSGHEEIASVLERVAALIREPRDRGVCKDSAGNNVGNWEIVLDVGEQDLGVTLRERAGG